MVRRVVGLIGVAALVGIVGGGGGSGSSSSSTPGTPTTPTQTNRAPVINSLNITPSFGVSELTSLNYSASPTDPDGDTVTYTWDLAGTAASGGAGTITFVGG